MSHMRLDVRIPMNFVHAAGSGRGITQSLSTQTLTMEVPIDAAVGTRMEIQAELIGSNRRIEFGAQVTAATPIPRRTERLVTLGNFQIEPEDARTWAAWLIERQPLVQRGRSADEIAPQGTRGALFEVAADFSEVIVAWPTRAAFARTFRDEIARNSVKVRGSNGAAQVGALVRVAFLIPQGAPAQVSGKVVAAQKGEVEIELQMPAEVALRLASYARG
jgi:hypothetical protein